MDNIKNGGNDTNMAELREFLQDHCGFDDALINGIIDLHGATCVQDLEGLDENDLMELGLKKLPAKSKIRCLQEQLATVFGTNQPQQSIFTAGVSQNELPAEPIKNLLPEVQIGKTWLESIEHKDVLSLGVDQYIAAIESAIADRFNLFEVPNIVSKAMKDYSLEANMPLDKSYYEIRNIITRHEYGNLFAALDVNSADIDEASRRELIRRINTHLFPLVPLLIRELDTWFDRWNKTAQQNMAMSVARMANPNDANRRRMPELFPETSSLINMSNSVIKALNTCLAGTGSVAALAMAYEANTIRDCLDNPELPRLVGAIDKERMLIKLGIDLDPAIINMEKSIVQFIIAFAQAKELTVRENAGDYFYDLYQLGCEITCWDKLANRESALMKSDVPPADIIVEAADVTDSSTPPLLDTNGVVGQINGATTAVPPESRKALLTARDPRI